MWREPNSYIWTLLSFDFCLCNTAYNPWKLFLPQILAKHVNPWSNCWHYCPSVTGLFPGFSNTNHTFCFKGCRQGRWLGSPKIRSCVAVDSNMKIFWVKTECKEFLAFSSQSWLASFPDLPRLQFLIAYSMQKLRQAIKNWSWGRPGNESKSCPQMRFLIDSSSCSNKVLQTLK